jgi:hypothetical protein
VLKKAEHELAAFLAALPDYQRKSFEFGLSSLTQDEMLQWADWIAPPSEQFSALQQEYFHLLQAVPARLREYVQRERRENDRLFGSYLPRVPEGRPRKDALANEAVEFKKAGMSYARIAMQLNREHGEGTTTKENIRGLLKARRLHSSEAALPPEKT